MTKFIWTRDFGTAFILCALYSAAGAELEEDELLFFLFLFAAL